MLKPVPFYVFPGNLEEDMDSELTNVTGDSNLPKGGKVKNGRMRSQL